MASLTRSVIAKSVVFAYGNTRLENEHITKVDIDDAMESLRTESDSTVIYT